MTSLKLGSLRSRPSSIVRQAAPGLLALLSLAACNRPAPASPFTDAGSAPNLDAADPKKLLEAVDALAGPLKNSPKSFEVLTALGNLYYDNGRYLDAVDSLRQAVERAAPALASLDALQARAVKPAAELPLECRRAPPSYGLEQIAAAAKKFEESEPSKALRCDEEILPAALDAQARHADALYLIGQPDAALAEHKQVLARAPDSPESLFFVGAITLEQSNGDKKKLEEGKYFWRHLLEVAPNHPRAALVRESLPKAEELFAPKPESAPQAQAAGALPPGHPQMPDGADSSQLPPGHPPMDGSQGSPTSPMAHAGPTPEQVQNVADAVAQTERTPELESGLDTLTANAESDLDNGRFQEARDKMVRVMPMRPGDARTAADLGAAMAGLGKTEMAERVLGRALESDPKQPRALYEMGKLLAARNDKVGARAKFEAVKASDAKFAAAHQVDRELSKL